MAVLVDAIPSHPACDDLPSSLSCNRQFVDAFAGYVNLLGVKGVARSRLIDEFSPSIYPAVDGVAGTPSIVDYDGADGKRSGAGQMLRLINCESL